jgi:4-amino-4-deoxy-L-arabinose transferase-like glycosyltransferase
VSARAAACTAPALLAAAALALLLANLGNGCLWQDEAQTALIARTVLEQGAPRGTDGTNFFSQELGAEYGPDHLWRWHTWLQFYVVAASFALLGGDTLAARAPFALFGAGTVLATYVLAGRVWRSRRAALFAGLLLLTSVPFLVLARQCRYYSLAAFFSILALYAYLRVLDRSRLAPWIFVASAALLFQAHYVYCAALLAAVGTDALLFHRAVLKRLLVLTAVSAGLNLPWVLWLAGMPYGERYGSRVQSLGQSVDFAREFLDQLGRYVFPPLLLVLPLALAVSRRSGSAPGSERQERIAAWKRWVLPGGFVLATVAVLSLVAPFPFFRYLAPAVPVCCVLMASIAESATRRHFVLGPAILAGWLLLFQRQPLRDYLHEITHDYDGPVEGIVRYLDEHARPGEVVAITYEDLPLKFYTRLRVVGGLTGEDLSPARDADWVIVRHHVNSINDSRVHDYLVRNVPWEKYRRIEIDYPDAAYENRESPQEHRFRTATDAPRVAIHRRVEP